MSVLESHRVETPHGPLHLGAQRVAKPLGQVLYLHGATFPTALSVFFRFDGRSWADALNEAGFSLWGLDLPGFGASRSALPPGDRPGSRAEELVPHLLAAIEKVRQSDPGVPLALISHSWGTIVAGKAIQKAQAAVRALVLFGPIVQRQMPLPPNKLPRDRLLSVWEQYRRFIEDVPRGQGAVLLDRHMQRWSEAYLATDPEAVGREPPAVRVPTGPLVDIADTWRGTAPYDASALTLPCLVVRGEWDSLCTDADAQRLLGALRNGRDHKIARGTHLMHLEESRTALHEVTNRFLLEHLA
ncbi:MAG: alpha/beta fold hydrolase [Proteobacteria bacterium]|nr:alpha/beta fold hydrolase [Pseudomonadota bacterium]